MSWLPDEAEMGVGVDEVLAEVVPTEPPAVVVLVVVLAYTGELVATELVVVTGLTTVQGQLVMVMVVLSVRVLV